MRSVPLLCLAALLGSCAVGPQPPLRSPSGQLTLDRLLAGKAVSGRPLGCLPSYSSNDMTVIDARTLAFRAGSSTTYVMTLSGGCDRLGGGSIALLTRQHGGMGLCQGDIAEAVDTVNHFTVGSCVIEGIVPYSRPRG